MTPLVLIVLALAVFAIWEVVKPLAPDATPDVVVAILLGGVAYALNQWVPVELVQLISITGAVGILHRQFGASSAGTHAISLPRKQSGVPSLPR